jgi:hypothetical protein
MSLGRLENPSYFLDDDGRVYLQSARTRFIPVNIFVKDSQLRTISAFPDDITKEVKELDPCWAEYTLEGIVHRLEISARNPYKFPIKG